MDASRCAAITSSAFKHPNTAENDAYKWLDIEVPLTQPRWPGVVLISRLPSCPISAECWLYHCIGNQFCGRLLLLLAGCCLRIEKCHPPPPPVISRVSRHRHPSLGHSAMAIQHSLLSNIYSSCVIMLQRRVRAEWAVILKYVQIYEG